MSATVNASIDRDAVLTAIHDNIRMVAQWEKMQDFATAAHYQARAQALIELLEVDDCGSVGGFDKARGQPSMPLNLGPSILPRFKWLCSLKTAPGGTRQPA